jgi:hypothetical protein
MINELFSGALRNLASPEWWAGEIPSWLVFGVIASFLFGVFGARMEGSRRAREQEPFEGWKLETVGHDVGSQSLYYEDVRRILASDFEFFKFVKSFCSTVCQLSTRSMHEARDVWVRVDKKRRRIVIDFTRIPPNQVSKWLNTMSTTAEAVL